MPNQPISLLGIHLVGATPENGRKLLLSVVLILAAWLLTWIARKLLRQASGDARRFLFWTRQGASLLIALVTIVGLLSIWFDDPTRLSTAFGLISAGVAFALQRVITAIAGYFVILRGKTFNVGDRIVMGGVRGDVIALSFMQTKIMEMGEPPPVSSAEPAMWVHSRQFTGRIVTVSNDKIFDEPVYNYTKHFPYIWEEMRLPVAYRDDRHKAEEILIEAARRHAVDHRQVPQAQLDELERRYHLHIDEMEPRVYWRITDNWLELAVRFLSPDHGTRGIKDAMSREVLTALDQAGIGIGSTTMEITGFPRLQVETNDGAKPAG